MTNGTPSLRSSEGRSLTWKCKCGAVSISGIANGAQYLSLLDLVAGFHSNRTRLQMCVERVEFIAQIENNEVPAHRIQRHPGRRTVG